MQSCNESAQYRAVPGAGIRTAPRAGLRKPRDVEPTGVFVVVEMTVLVFVTALAMVSVIVSIEDVQAHRPATASASVAAPQASLAARQGPVSIGGSRPIETAMPARGANQLAVR